MEAQMIIRKGDVVAVIAGKDKGKKGRILSVNREENRVLVEKVNMIKRHQKPNNKHPQGGIIEKEAYLHASNVLVFCDKCARGVRLKTVVNGARKSRACVKCDSVIVVKK